MNCKCEARLKRRDATIKAMRKERKIHMDCIEHQEADIKEYKEALKLEGDLVVKLLNESQQANMEVERLSQSSKKYVDARMIDLENLSLAQVCVDMLLEVEGKDKPLGRAMAFIKKILLRIE